jgi:16S rRNA (guanine527-N7)-methyltransferase
VKQSGDGREELRTAAARLGIPLSEGATRQLLSFETLLLEKAIPLGFVARSDRGRIRDRHILDSLRAAAEVREADRLALDLGSGAGLPGVVLAIAVPELRVGLVESQRRRVAFLELAVERLELGNADVLARRAEDLEPGSADLCTARAFAPPDRAWRVAEPLLAPGGRLVFFAGGGVQQAPAHASILSTRAAPLESAGPLVIMGR